MSPILGIWASAGTNTSFDSIATVTVGSGGSSTITFSSIPSTYQHLQLRYIARGALANAIKVQFNSDTGTNYAHHYVCGDGASTITSSSTSTNQILIQRYIGMATGTSIFSAGVIDILDYANTNKYTTTRHLGGQDSNGSGGIALESGLWMNTAAITTIDLIPNLTTIQQYSHFALYGIRSK